MLILRRWYDGLIMALEKTLRYIVIAGLFALPFIVFIVSTSLFFPYITGKNFAFRIIVEIITGAWLALALVNPTYRPRRSWVLAAFALFVFIIALADALGAVPFKSFWSNFERMDGWVTLAHLLMYLVVIVSVLNSEKLWRRLFQVSLAVSALVAVYGFLQVAGDLTLGQGGVSGLSARIDATFGNPIYLAVYMLFNIFIAALLWVQEWRERGASKRTPLALFYGGAIALDTLALFFTGTRGTMLGLIGGAMLAVFIFALVHGSRRARTIAFVSVAAVIVMGGSLWLARDTSFVKSIGFLDRLASISLTDSTIKARFLNMGIAWQGVKERPLFGWGQENYAIVFDKYYDPRMYGQEPWFDRVHDIIFDWWIAGGTLGLLAYLSIFGALLFAIWRSGVSGEHIFTDAEKVILTGLLAGYFVHNLTVFDNITSYILFATLLGYIAWREGEARKTKYVIGIELLPRSNLPFIAVAAALAVWGVAWWVNAGALAQNRALIQAIQPQSSGVSANIEYFKKAISYGSFGTQETREQLAQIASQVASAKDVDIPTKQQIFNMAVTEMMAQEKASPLDARFPLFLGVVFSSYGDYADAATALSRARDLSPRKQSLYFAIAQNQQQQGNQAGALQTLKSAYELDTDVNDARINYIAALIVAGQDALADEILAPIIPSGEAADPRIASAYVTRGEFGKIAAIWEAKVKASPGDQQAYLTLAAAYYEAGNTAKAISVLRDAEAAFPSEKDQAEKLIQDIQNGTAKVGGQ